MHMMMMASSTAEALHFKVKSASQEDVDQLCQNISQQLTLSDKASECILMLRHLFVLLQASDVEPCLSGSMLKELQKTAIQCDCEKNVSSKLSILCSLILKELMLGDKQLTCSMAECSDSSPKKALLSCYALQDPRHKCLQDVVATGVRWLGNKDFDSQRKAFVFLVMVSSLPGVVKKEYIAKTSEQLCSWLMNASLYQARNSYTLNPFRKDEESQVTEIDGTPCRNVFTILNIGQYYTDDQYLNIYSFSLLYKWLYHCSQIKASQVSQSAVEGLRGKTLATGLGGSPKQMSPVLMGDSPKGRSSIPAMEGSPRRMSTGGEGSPRKRTELESCLTELKVPQSMISRSVDYCFRVMDQCERKAKVSSDAELQIACLSEVVVILDLVCKLDSGQIPRVHQEMRRLYTRLSKDPTHSPTILCILQFFLNHSAKVVHDPQEVYSHFFSVILSQQFRDPGLAFDTVVFMSNNLSTLCYTTNIFTHFFPNILKILAWHPRAYLKEFLDLLPAMMTPLTSLEIFHTLLDLPCMTAALEVMEKAKKVEPPNTSHGASLEPSSCVEAYYTPRFKPLFNFICRAEGGQGDTINRLSNLHQVLEDVKHNPRVFCCSQLVPVFIRRWFNVIMEEAEEEFVIQILPAMLERSGLLFSIQQFKADIIMILGEQLLVLVDKYPGVMVEHIADITEFIHITNNMQGRQNLYGNLVYCIGEYCSSQCAQNCTPEIIAQYFDVLEVVTYEICGNMLVEEDEMVVHPKILCHLMSAMAKLSSRRQDLIPRTILCLTKVAKQNFALTQDPLAQEALLSCAQEHVNLLKVPSFAVTVLNPSSEIYSGRWHRDGYSLPFILRGIKRVMTDKS